MNEINQRLRVMLGIEPTQADRKIYQMGEVGKTDQCRRGSLPKPTSLLQAIFKRDVCRIQNRKNWRLKVESILKALKLLHNRFVTRSNPFKGSGQSGAHASGTDTSSRTTVYPVVFHAFDLACSRMGHLRFWSWVSPFTEKPAWHDGLDIGASPNAPVQAPAQGRIIMVSSDSKMGNMVKIDHGYGVETV